MEVSSEFPVNKTRKNNRETSVEKQFHPLILTLARCTCVMCNLRWRWHEMERWKDEKSAASTLSHKTSDTFTQCKVKVERSPREQRKVAGEMPGMRRARASRSIGTLSSARRNRFGRPTLQFLRNYFTRARTRASKSLQ